MDNKEKKTTNKTSKKSTHNKKPIKEKPLTIKEKAFCREYVKSGNGTQSVYKAGYQYKNDNTAGNAAFALLLKPKVKAEIERLIKKKEETAIMDAREVMELLSQVARGEIKDQFGLDASLNDRIKAMQEIAKRTIDIENRIKGVPDNQVIIKVDWKKE